MSMSYTGEADDDELREHDILEVSLDFPDQIYLYKPLSDVEDAIRLVRIKAESDDGLIRGTLIGGIVGEDAFVALSHVWGTELPTCRVLIDDQDFWIRPNLYDFLLHAQTHMIDIDLWIDAICVNQHNVHEKNNQVSMMGKIFRNADKVVAWLRSPVPSSLRHGSPQRGEVVKQLIYHHNLPADGQGLEYILLPSLRRLLSHVYWSRAWIVQEILLANDVELHWEGAMVTWNSSKAFLSKRDLENYTGLPVRGLLGSVFSSFPILGLLTFEPFEPSETLPLLSIVNNFSRQECDEVRDHIFAYLGLSELAGTGFQADYEEDLKLLNLRVALQCEAALFRDEKSLCIAGQLLSVTTPTITLKIEQTICSSSLERKTVADEHTYFDENIQSYSLGELIVVPLPDHVSWLIFIQAFNQKREFTRPARHSCILLYWSNAKGIASIPNERFMTHRVGAARDGELLVTDTSLSMRRPGGGSMTRDWLPFRDYAIQDFEQQEVTFADDWHQYSRWIDAIQNAKAKKCDVVMFSNKHG